MTAMNKPYTNIEVRKESDNNPFVFRINPFQWQRLITFPYAHSIWLLSQNSRQFFFSYFSCQDLIQLSIESNTAHIHIEQIFSTLEIWDQQSFPLNRIHTKKTEYMLSIDKITLFDNPKQITSRYCSTQQLRQQCPHNPFHYELSLVSYHPETLPCLNMIKQASLNYSM